VIATDGHDLETQIVSSPALEKVLREYGSEAKLAKVDVRKLLFDSSTVIGCLRLVSALMGLDLTFQQLSYGNFVDRETMLIDIEDLVTTVLNKSQRHDIDPGELGDHVRGCIGKHDALEISNGNDLIGILGVGLRKAIGSAKHSDVMPP